MLSACNLLKNNINDPKALTSKDMVSQTCSHCGQAVQSAEGTPRQAAVAGPGAAAASLLSSQLFVRVWAEGASCRPARWGALGALLSGPASDTLPALPFPRGGASVRRFLARGREGLLQSFITFPHSPLLLAKPCDPGSRSPEFLFFKVSICVCSVVVFLREKKMTYLGHSQHSF